MKFIDTPATVEWPEMQPVPRWHKNNPAQRRRDFATVAEAAKFTTTLPHGLAQITTADGIVLYQGDIDAILRQVGWPPQALAASPPA